MMQYLNINKIKSYYFYFFLIFCLLFSYIFREKYHELLIIHGDAIKIFSPKELFFYWKPEHLDFMNLESLNKGVIFRFLFYYSSVFLLGLSIIRPILSHLQNTSISLPYLLGMSFLPGYLLSISINRFITLFFPHQYAINLCFFLNAFFGLLFFLKTKKIKKENFEKFKYQKFILDLLLFSSVVFFFLVYQIQAGRNFLVGDSTIFFGKYLSEALNPIQFKHFFPIVDQQYDEIMFNYPLLYSQGGRELLYLTFWFLSGIGKASFLFLTIGFLKILTGLQSSKIFTLGTIFIFFGSFCFNPFTYVEHIPGSSPILFSMHIGRWVGIFFPALLISVAYKSDKKFNRYFNLLFFFLGIGYASTTFNNLVYAFLWLLCIYSFFNFRNSSALITSQLSNSRYALLSKIFLFILPLVSYVRIDIFKRRTLDGLLLVFSCIFIFYVLIRQLDLKKFKNNFLRNLLKSEHFWIISFISGVVISSLFLGNLLSFKILSKFIRISDFTFLPGAYYEDFLVRGRISLPETLQIFSYVGAGAETKHSASFWYFMIYYGLVVFMGFLSYRTLLKKIQQKNDEFSVIFHHFLLLTSLGIFWASFFMLDYIRAPIDYFIKVRLIEVPLYWIFICFFITAACYFKKNEKFFTKIGLFFWGILPFVLNYGFQQWWSNFIYFCMQLRHILRTFI